MSSALLLALLLSSAQAADLQVSVLVPGAAAPVRTVIHDVAPGPLPGLALPGADGVTYLVWLTVTPKTDGNVRFDAEIQSLTPDRHDTIVRKTVSRPAIETLPGQTATFRQGARVPIPDAQPVQYREEGFALEMIYTDPASTTVLTTAAQVEGLLGLRVRVTGTVGRAKLGDLVQVGDVSVCCLDVRVADDRLSGPVTLEGRLERTDAFQSHVDPDGAISQGTAPGSTTLVLRDCVVR